LLSAIDLYLYNFVKNNDVYMGLKSVIQNNKAVIKFLALFFGSYIILTLLYQAYLNYFPSENHYPDYITHQVAKQSYEIIKLLGYNTYFTKDPSTSCMLIGIDNSYISRVIEGCNSISVIILFLSFILAFWKGAKPTFFFILAGSILIYFFNVIRISLITIGIHFYPEYKDLLHDIFFPLFIYGIVFLLWIYWIRSYKKTTQS
jgi:exosortase family protein XrtF